MAAILAWGTPGFVSWAEETTPGTEISPANWLGKVMVMDPRERNNVKRHRHAGSLNPLSWTPGKKETDFSVRFRVNEGKIFHLAYGAEAVTGSDPYEHILTVARPLPSGTFELAIPDGSDYFTRRYIGSKCAKLSLGLAVDGVLIADMDFAALKVASYTVKTAITDNVIKPYNFDQMVLTLNAGAVANCRNFQMTLNNKVETIFHLGQREGNTWKEGAPENDLTVEMTANASTWWDAWNADPPTEMDADCDLIRTASSDEFQIKWFNMPIEDPGMPLPEEGEIIQTLSFPPLSSQLVITDAVATYAAA